MSLNDFRVIFMGTPEFAVASLKSLLEAGFNVVAVVTTPDKPAGRGQKIHESDVKKFAIENHLPVLQPEKLKDPVFIENLKAFNADLQVVVAFRMLPEVVWSMPKKGTINLHASLLPQYRGAAPINWAIINGDQTSGVTTFFIEREIDTGKIIYKKEVPIKDDDNAGTLHDKLMITGAALLTQTVEAIRNGNYPQTDQFANIPKGTLLKPAPKIFKDDCRIPWEASVKTTQDFIRGLSPYPAAWTVLEHEETSEKLSAKLFSTVPELANHSHKPGTLITDEKKILKVAVLNGFIHVLSLQLEGKKRLSTEEFLRGFKNLKKFRAI